jgi:tetratricopeptide (TPR) repeat protein
MPPARNTRAAQDAGDRASISPRVRQSRGHPSRVLKDSPGDAQAALMLAESYFAAERYGDAITECDKLIAQHRDSAFVYRRKGFAQLSLKRYREAKVSLEKAHEKIASRCRAQEGRSITFRVCSAKEPIRSSKN